MIDRGGRDETDRDVSETESDPDAAETELTSDSDRDLPGATGTDVDSEAADRPKPLEDLAATVAERADAGRSRSSSPDFDDLFDRQDVAEIDGDRLWEHLETDDPIDPGEEMRPVERDVREIEKRAYCQDCDYFAEPPEVACTREGTEILAVPTVRTFRVTNCPFVLEDTVLEDS
ncbi:hypothetical protein [Natrinema caseinilyticum]|uniref:hypothetical protein n=1 Tax=Natrinema caseinilyticum TaxID=2961570 RepID=UPI0020C1D1D0|nr:hypothetical protein [Natrinema caseinilyticum]